MKSIVLAMSLVFSASTFAKVPATEAINKLLAAGSYQGENCSVTVNTTSDSVTISVKSETATHAFAILNASSNYTVDSATGEISASQSLRFPRYLQGGTKFLNVRPSNDQVEFYISETLLDHRGNDMSTYASCAVNR